MTADNLGIKLLAGETVTMRSKMVSTFQQTPPLSAPDTLAALCNAGTTSEIGLTGPVMASMHRASSEGIRELGAFEALFARDALIAALLVKEQYPSLLLSTVQVLAGYQGTSFGSSNEEEPGRIPHEVRRADDPIALQLSRDQGWTWPYFGAIDTTPLFIIAMAELINQRCPDPSLVSAANAAIDWLIWRLETGRGMLISNPSIPKGIENQIWKDSWDAYSDREGRVSAPPCAPIMAQAIAYQGCMAGIKLLTAFNTTDGRVRELRRMAYNLREIVLGKFWIPNEERFGACLLLPTETRSEGLLTIKTSDPGHLLTSGMFDQDSDLVYRNGIIRAVVSEDMLCGGGIRTLSSVERRYRPTAYHNGSSWPWDTTTIILGLDKFGFHRLADALAKLVVRVYTQTGLFPEFVRGDSGVHIRLNSEIIDIKEEGGVENRISQPPQEIQAFTVSAILALQYRERHRPASSPGLSAQELALEDQLLLRINPNWR